MANLILASKRVVKSGSEMWHVYRLSENNKSDEFYCSSALKALRYSFILRKQGGGFMPKAVYGKLMAEVNAGKAQAEQSQEAEPKKAARKNAKNAKNAKNESK